MMSHFGFSSDFNFDEHDLDHGLGFDYESQLAAARRLLSQQDWAHTQLESEISQAGEFARKSSGEANDYAVDRHIELIHDSIYQSAAHSMAAVGMLAPLIESIFRRAFQCIGEELPTKDLVKRILRVIDDESIGMSEYMPEKLKPTLEALFQYRNKMFHNGFEWPADERRKFDSNLSQWPEGWFERSTSGSEPWMFYMTTMFISHCIDIAEGILLGLIRFWLGPGRALWKCSESADL